MTDFWPLVAAMAVALTALCVKQWLDLRAAALQRAEERAEREKGIVPLFEEVRDEMRAARTEMKTFIANNRGRNG